jgi:hypothetical protein
LLVWYKADLIIISLKIYCSRHDIAEILQKVMTNIYYLIQHLIHQGLLWHDLYDRWIYLCNQCLLAFPLICSINKTELVLNNNHSFTHGSPKFKICYNWKHFKNQCHTAICINVCSRVY